MCEHQGVGITRNELRPGAQVMVPVGTIAAAVNGHPTIIALATVVGPADPAGDASVMVNPDDVWWLDVYMGAGVTPLPQMYPARQILGIPALGLTMPGVPAQPPV